MCGIAGAINYKKFDLEKVQEELHHRGPDDQGIYRYKDVALVHTRLAIQDIALGAQPMHYGPFTIIYNGEIYNHMELRRQLDDEFLTRSDTETLLHLYARYKEKCLNMMDGMFACAILDQEAHTIFLARDRAGKKPLYIYQDENSLLFASELNAIRSAVRLEIDKKRIGQYFRYGEFYKFHTPYKNVTELEAGSFVRIDISTRKVTRRKWWRIFDFYRNPQTVSFAEALGKVDGLLRQAVKRRLENSELEVGTFLSGGIDSTLITAIASDYQSKLKTFTVSFDGSYNEAPLAQLVVQKYQTDHTEINITYENLQNDLVKILGNYGEPFTDSSAVPSYYVSKEAKKHLTVILNGDGADEIFGGYRRYVPFAKVDFFRLNNLFRLLARCIKRVAPPAHERMSFYNYLYRLLDLAGKKGYACYLSAATISFEGYEENLLSEDNYSEEFQEDFEQINNSELSGLKKIMNLDFDTFLTSTLLVKMDIATMAHSLEGRSPFLCKEFLEYAPTLPDDYKIKGKTTKYILRELAKKYLPPELIYQPKRGFEIPLKRWVEGQLKEIIYDNLDRDCYSGNFVKKDFLSNLLHKRIRISDEKRAQILWTLLGLEIWHKNILC
ncbi:asparagine synthase (glutamine-hydrolyzing) [Planctomycetota bacterium]